MLQQSIPAQLLWLAEANTHTLSDEKKTAKSQNHTRADWRGYSEGLQSDLLLTADARSVSRGFVKSFECPVINWMLDLSDIGGLVLNALM